MIIKCWSLLFKFPKYASLYHRCIMTAPCVTGGIPVLTRNPSPTSKYFYYLFQVSKAAITKHNKPEAKMTEIFSFPVLEAENKENQLSTKHGVVKCSGKKHILCSPGHGGLQWSLFHQANLSDFLYCTCIKL